MLIIYKKNYDQIVRWWRNIDKSILSVFIILFFLGLFFSFSSTSSIAGDRFNKETYFFFLKHLAYLILSISLMFFISFQGRDNLNKYIFPIFLLSLFFLVIVPFFGVEVKGSKRWIDFPLLPRFQPIEIVKPLLIVVIAKVLSDEKQKINLLRYSISFIILLFVLLFLIYQPDFGQSLILVVSWISMIFVSGVNLIYLFSIAIISFLSIFLIIFLFPEKFGYIAYRLKSFVDPSKGENYQSQKALDAINQGGFYGQGMGEGILKEQVPEAHTDYIVAVIAEEFGTISIMLIILIFIFVATRVISKIYNEDKEFIKIVLVGLITILLSQAFIHIGVNIRLFPTTGMTLPFLSYGGSSLIGSSIVAGIILNYTRRNIHNIV